MHWLVSLMVLVTGMIGLASYSVAGGMGNIGAMAGAGETAVVIRQPRFVCFDGRSLSVEGGNSVWYARRGCFKSMIPCNVYQAGHYGRYYNETAMNRAMECCRHNYPFRLGEMQTH